MFHVEQNKNNRTLSGVEGCKKRKAVSAPLNDLACVTKKNNHI